MCKYFGQPTLKHLFCHRSFFSSCIESFDHRDKKKKKKQDKEHRSSHPQYVQMLKSSDSRSPVWRAEGGEEGEESEKGEGWGEARSPFPCFPTKSLTNTSRFFTFYSRML